MKKIFTLLLMSLTFCIVQAQSFWSCSRSFIDQYPGVTVGTIYNEYYGKGSSGDDITGFTDVVYAEDNGNADGDDELKGATCPVRNYTCRQNDADGTVPLIHYDGTLKYDVYYPIISGITTPLTLPAIFFFHPGGFSDCSYKSLPGIAHMCNEFALRGFVAFNVEYRRGIIQDQNPPLTYATVQQQMAIYRACQDARGAIRSIFQRQDDGWENNLYRINKNQIFLAGMSAGGLIAMNLAYYTDDSHIAQIFPTTGTYTAAQLLGPIDADFYYGAPTIPFQTSIKAVLDMWGGLPLPKSYYGLADQSSFFSGNTYNPPLIAFAGLLDDVFPLPVNTPKQQITFSPVYYSENRCLPNNPPYSPYKVNKNANTVDLAVGSTLNMYTILKTLGVPAEMYIDCQMHHGLDANCSTSGCFKSDFGTGDTNTTDVQTYMVQRACIFFQDYINGVVNTGTTLFYDCENTRGSCNANYTGCSSSSCSSN